LEADELENYVGPVNPTDDWRVSAKLISFGGGGANVEVALFNRAFGALPPFTIRVDWKQGQETSDVEALALQLLAQSVQQLRARAIEEAYRLSS